MVEWVEDGSNYDIIRGESTTDKSMGHGNGNSGFGLMAEHVHSVVMADMQATGVFDARHAQKWDAATCQNRWNSFFRRYKKMHERVHSQTGFGLTEAQRKKGLTLEEGRIDSIFGQQANVDPICQTHQPCEDDWFPINDEPPKEEEEEEEEEGEEEEEDEEAGDSGDDVDSTDNLIDALLSGGETSDRVDSRSPSHDRPLEAESTTVQREATDDTRRAAEEESSSHPTVRRRTGSKKTNTAKTTATISTKRVPETLAGDTKGMTKRKTLSGKISDPCTTNRPSFGFNWAKNALKQIKNGVKSN
ncbi:hypothetical protein DVH05_026149 [Phytophthora capsici]|nr:hypothetical protein DVH05_026149 [Phytophthora capsici]